MAFEILICSQTNKSRVFDFSLRFVIVFRFLIEFPFRVFQISILIFEFLHLREFREPAIFCSRSSLITKLLISLSVIFAKSSSLKSSEGSHFVLAGKTVKSLLWLVVDDADFYKCHLGFI